MGGAGDLLSLALSVPPWEELHELTPPELRQTNLVTTDRAADVLPWADVAVPMAELGPKEIGKETGTKPVQDRFASEEQPAPQAQAKSTRTAEVAAPTGGVAAATAK
jgi:hypothetical protein